MKKGLFLVAISILFVACTPKIVHLDILIKVILKQMQLEIQKS